jgi:hypothetical protein
MRLHRPMLRSLASPWAFVGPSSIAFAFASASTALFPSQSRLPMRSEGPFSWAGTQRTERRSPGRSAIAFPEVPVRDIAVKGSPGKEMLCHADNSLAV